MLKLMLYTKSMQFCSCHAVCHRDTNSDYLMWQRKENAQFTLAKIVTHYAGFV